jgi:hypothetical protein
MTRVCLLGADDVNLRYELLSRETAREALATYDLREPFANAIGLDTVSLGAAVSLLNDLNWYLVRFAESAFVLEPSVSDAEWLSRELATAVRDGDVDPEETGRFLTVYGLAEPSDEDQEFAEDAPQELVEPMFVTRTGDGIPEYDLHDVEETFVVRVTESEFGA